MATGPTTIRGTQVTDGTIQRVDLDVSTVGLAVIAKLVQGANITISSTGADSGTGDVTINAIVPAAPVPSVFGRTGAITAQSGDYSAFYPLLTTGYVNPTWIAQLAWSKITGTPTTLAGYGITNAEPALGNPAANNMILQSTVAGVRSWVTPAGGGLQQVTSDTTLSGLGTSASPLAVIAVNGVTDGSNAAAGDVGEYLSIVGGSVSLSTGVQANATSLTLTAGDWEMGGSISVQTSGITPSVTVLMAGLNTTSATLPAAITNRARSDYNPAFAGASSTPFAAAIPIQRFNVTASTIVYLVGQGTFSAGSLTMQGAMWARRVR
jgi:hypothetical protein